MVQPRNPRLEERKTTTASELPPPNTSFFGWLGQRLPGPAEFVSGTAMPFLAKTLENPIFLPLIGADWAADNFVRRPLIGAPAATLQNLTATGEFDPIEAYKQTSREALPGNSISMGQSTSTLLSQRIISRNPIIGGLLRQAELDDDLYKYVPFLDPNFDIMDPQQRKEAYLDSFYGSLITGTVDVALELLLGKGAGGLMKLGRTKSGISRKPDPATERNLEAEILTGRQAWIDQEKPIAPGKYKAPNGFSVHVYDLLVEKNPVKLLNNPILGNSPHLAELGALIDDWDTAATFALAARGNARAALALKQTSPAIADSLNAELFPPPLKPLTTADELADFSSMSDADKIADISARFNDLVQRDPALQVLVDDFAFTTARGQSLNPTWAPSKFAGIERVKNFLGKTKTIRYQAATGPAIEEVMVGGGIFRPILSLHQRGMNLKPLGHVQLTGSYPRDLYDEVTAVISDSTYLKQLERNPATRPEVARLREETFRKINLAVDETAKRAALESYERAAMALIVIQRAKELGYENVAIDPTPMIEKVLAKRNLTIKTASDTGFVADDFFTDVHVGSNLKSKLPDSVVLVDLNVFKKMVDDEMAARRPLMDHIAGYGERSARAIQMTGENINSFFSAAVLIRPGYIPKNSVFEPAMRYMMETGNLFDMNLFLPAITNSLRNNKGRINALTDGISHLVIPSKRKATQRVRAERLEIIRERNRIYKESIDPLNEQIKIAIQIREDLRKNPFGYSKEKHAAQMKKSGEKIEALIKSRNMVVSKAKDLDVAISALSQKLPRATMAQARGIDETIMARKQNIFLRNGDIVEYRGFTEDGGASYLQELGDASSSMLNAVGFATMSRRQKALGYYEEPQKGTIRYWKELETEIERFSKADPAGKSILQGKTLQEVADEYLKGYEELGVRSPLYRLVAGKRGADIDAGSPNLDDLSVTPADARYFAEKAFEFADVFLADPTIRATALTRRIGWKELRERFNDYYETLPPLSPVFYPADAVGVEKITNGIIGLQREGFKLITAPEVNLFRYQLADNAYQEGLQIMTETALDQGKELTFATMRDIENSARKYASQKVTQTFYQVRRMNNYQYYSKFLLGFPTAMYNSLKFYALMGLANPYNYAILEQIRTSPWAIGTVVNEENQRVNEKGFLIDDSGNYVDKYGTKTDTPVENQLEAHLLVPTYSEIFEMAKTGERKGSELIQPFRKKLNVRQANFLTSGPSAVWFIQIPLKKTIASFPSLEVTLKNALTERGYGNLIFEGRVGPGFGSPIEEAVGFAANFIPASMRKLVELAQSGVDELLTTEGNAITYKTGPVAIMLHLIHGARRANRAISDPTNKEEPDIQTSVDATFGSLTTRLFERIASPLGFTYEPTSILYQDELSRLSRYYSIYPEEAGGLSPRDAALAQLIAQNGDDVLTVMGFLTGSTKRPVSLDFSQEVALNLEKAYKTGLLQKAVGQNKERLQSLPIILEPVIPGEFSSAAYSFITSFNKSGINLKGVPRDFYDMQAEAQRQAGWYEWSKLQNKINSLLLGRPSKSLESNPDINQIKKTKVAELQKLYPAWYEESGGSKTTPKFKSNLAVIDVALEDDNFMNGLTGPDKTLWKFIEAWYVEYDSLIGPYESSVDKTFRAETREYWSKRTMQLIQANTYFADFHSRWLSGDQIIDTSKITTEAKFAATPEAQQTQQQLEPSAVDRISGLLGIGGN